MSWFGQRIYPVPYQWRRIAALAATAVVLTAIAKLIDLPLVVAAALALLYPAFLGITRFYLPEERRALIGLMERAGILARNRPRSGDQAS
jgi:hypothetical protein